jgi:hypothetical protein
MKTLLIIAVVALLIGLTISENIHTVDPEKWCEKMTLQIILDDASSLSDSEADLYVKEC